MDVSLKESRFAPLGGGEFVSILVLLDVSLKATFVDVTRVIDGVSILVLLDVSLKVLPPGYNLAGLAMFQSLFFWMSV